MRNPHIDELLPEYAFRKVGFGCHARMTYEGGKGGGSAPSPDPQIGKAALMNAEIGKEWLAFAKDQFAAGNVRQEDMDALTNKIIDQQLGTQDQTNAWAQEDRARYKQVFQPLQDEFIKQAEEYGSVDRQNQAAAEAKTDVQKAAETQSQINARTMASMGVNPVSGRFQGMSRSDSMNVGLAEAGAQNAARSQMRDKALALKADAINMGNGLPSSAASAYGIGLSAGNSAAGNMATGQNSYYQNRNVMSQGFAGAQQGYANQGNILANLYGQQVNAWGAQQQANATSSAGTGAAVGSIAGAALMVF